MEFLEAFAPAECHAIHLIGAGGKTTLMFALKSARDVRIEVGNSLFPECFRSDFHGIRSVVEAYSRSAVLSGRDEAEVVGPTVRTGASFVVRVKVVTRLGEAIYDVDRWD